MHSAVMRLHVVTRLSLYVCPSVMFRYRDHIGWNSFARLTSDDHKPTPRVEVTIIVRIMCSYIDDVISAGVPVAWQREENNNVRLEKIFWVLHSGFATVIETTELLLLRQVKESFVTDKLYGDN